MSIEEILAAPVVDKQVVAEMRELLAEEFDEVLAEYLVDARQQIAAIERAAQQGERQAICVHAHTLGSSSAHLGFKRLSGYAHYVELLSRGAQEEDYRSHAAILWREYRELSEAVGVNQEA